MKKITLIHIIIGLFLKNGYSQLVQYYPESSTGKIICHTHYSLSYSAEHKQAEWVIYSINKNLIEKGQTKRKDFFRPDPLLVDSFATLADYKNSGFDRGHLAPAADMKIDSIAMSESFYLSNMSPQTPSLNRGIWKNLEEQVRRWTIKYDTLYVVTGGTLGFSKYSIGFGKITVPDYFYKIILNTKKFKFKGIAFIIPNSCSFNQLEQYAVSIDSVEYLTGIDFFYLFPDSIEDNFESKICLNCWDFGNINLETPKSLSNNNSNLYCIWRDFIGQQCNYSKMCGSNYCKIHTNINNAKSVNPNEKLDKSVQCSGVTKAGTRCKHMTYFTNGFCFQHGGR